MSQEEKWIVHWNGPFSYEEVVPEKKGKAAVTIGAAGDPEGSGAAARRQRPATNKGNVLYQLYGTHPLYGPNRLLYIGKTMQGPQRFVQHSHWVSVHQNEITVHLGSVDEFKDWEKWKKDKSDVYPAPADDKVVHRIESLLIYAHAPAYNTQNTQSIGKALGIRVFNTGRFGMLFPEVSSLYMAPPQVDQNVE